MSKLTDLGAWSTAAMSAIAVTFSLTTPASAATFSGVSSFLEFTNFSKAPIETTTSTNADTLAVSSGGTAITEASAEAIFDQIEPWAFNKVDSWAEGEGLNYLGWAQSEASLAGFFNLAAQETLSFDFSGALLLSTAIERSNLESAFALGGVGFALLGEPASQSPVLWDSFALGAFLETPGDGDFLNASSCYNWLQGQTAHLLVHSCHLQTQIGGLEEWLSLEFNGSYARTFTEATQVSLIDFKTGTAGVQAVPAPSLLWGLLTYGVLGLFKRHRDIA